MSTSEKKSRAMVANAFEPTVNQFPDNAGVILAFHGLMCFCHNTMGDNAFSEIGIHSHSDDHTFMMTVLKVSPNFDPPNVPGYTVIEEYEPYLVEHTGNLPTSIVKFEVHNPRSPAGVRYFKHGSSSGNQPNDFSRVPDLESSEFYGEYLETMPDGRRILRKVVDMFGPVVHVTDGLFYTWQLTKFDTKRRAKKNPSTHVKRLGKVAEVVGANIYLNTGGYVDLLTEGFTERLQPTNTYKYLVRIDNLCPRDVCTGIDFDLYDLTFKKPAAAPRLELVKDDDRPVRDEEKSAEDMEVEAARAAFFADQKQLRGPLKPKSNDDSPCGEASFGISRCLVCE